LHRIYYGLYWTIIVGENQMLYLKFRQGLRRSLLALSIIIALTILVKSLTPAMPSLSISNGDKLIHVLAYLVLGLATLPVLPRLRPLLVCLGVAGFGAGVEILQGMVNTGRSTDVYDGIANALGALLALGIWILLSRIMTKPSEIRENKRK